MLHRYGQELCCLDATYKTTKYALQMFFIVVKTNVDYQVSFFLNLNTLKFQVTHIKCLIEFINGYNVNGHIEFYLTLSSGV